MYRFRLVIKCPPAYSIDTWNKVLWPALCRMPWSPTGCLHPDIVNSQLRMFCRLRSMLRRRMCNSPGCNMRQRMLLRPRHVLVMVWSPGIARQSTSVCVSCLASPNAESKRWFGFGVKFLDFFPDFRVLFLGRKVGSKTTVFFRHGFFGFFVVITKRNCLKSYLFAIGGRTR